jgi:hypothetical protein
MKYIVALLLWCGLGAVPAHANPLSGTWQYDGFFFQGHRYPTSDPGLFLTFTFTENYSRLYWERKGESGFCERIAEFRAEENILFQKVVWVNPQNNAECAKDPDMQLGVESQVKFQTPDNFLHFFFDINGQEFIYILKQTGCVFD